MTSKLDHEKIGIQAKLIKIVELSDQIQTLSDSVLSDLCEYRWSRPVEHASVVKEYAEVISARTKHAMSAVDQIKEDEDEG